MPTRTADTEPAITGNHPVAVKFFTAIARERFTGELIELRYRLEDGHRMGQIFERPSRVGALARRAIALSERVIVRIPFTGDAGNFQLQPALHAQPAARHGARERAHATHQVPARSAGRHRRGRPRPGQQHGHATVAYWGG